MAKTDGEVSWTETCVNEVKVPPYRWLHSSKLSDNYFRRFRNATGVTSLFHMAVRSTVKYRRLLDADALRDLPWDPFGQLLWQQMVKLRGNSVHVWKSFAEAYQDNAAAASELDRANSLLCLPAELPIIAIPLFSSTGFLTSLSLSKASWYVADWMDICKLTNLRILVAESQRDDLGFTSQVTRAWTEHCTQAGAFRSLRALGLIAPVGDMHLRSMEQLWQLPVLDAIHLSGLDLEGAKDPENGLVTEDLSLSWPSAPFLARVLDGYVNSRHPREDPNLSKPRLELDLCAPGVEKHKCRDIHWTILRSRNRIKCKRPGDSPEHPAGKQSSKRLRGAMQRELSDVYSSFVT